MSSGHTNIASMPRLRVVARTLAVAIAAAVLVAGPGAGETVAARERAGAQAPAAVSLPEPGAAEAEFVARINQLRASKGLGALSVDAELTARAREWASTMAGQGRIFHAGDLSAGIGANWQKLGENVGVGGDVGVLFQAFVDSPSHYANLVDPAYTRVGVGVVNSGGRIFTTHRFMALAPPPPPTTAPPPTAPPTTAAPTTIAPPTTAASPPTAPPPTTTTTTAAPEPNKLGPIDRIAGLVARTSSD